MEKRIFKLKHPVTVGEYHCEELALVRPRTKDFVAVGPRELGTVGADVALLASITGQPEVVIDQLDIDDLAKLRYECARIWAAYFDQIDGYSLNPQAEATPPAQEP